MNEIYVHTHLGLGDHIVCNAIYRRLAKENDKVYIFVKPHNMSSVNFMLRDLENVYLISANDIEAEKYILDNNLTNSYLRIGHENLNTNVSFDKSFYHQMGMDFSKRWLEFFLDRDLYRENILKNNIKTTSPYIFIHDDETRGFKINNSYIPQRKIIRPDKKYTDNIFDYIGLITEAEQIHVIDSSFALLIDSLDFIKGNLVFHHYARASSVSVTPSFSEKWGIIK